MSREFSVGNGRPSAARRRPMAAARQPPAPRLAPRRGASSSAKPLNVGPASTPATTSLGSAVFTGASATPERINFCPRILPTFPIPQPP